jgi:methyl-accepting chemotaxis protein
MSGPPSDPWSLPASVLQKARELAEEVHETAERVHQQALEAHRLTEIARRQAERGRDLLRSGREGMESITGSIKSSLDAAVKAERRLAGKGED